MIEENQYTKGTGLDYFNAIWSSLKDADITTEEGKKEIIRTIFFEIYFSTRSSVGLISGLQEEINTIMKVLNKTADTFVNVANKINEIEERIK